MSKKKIHEKSRFAKKALTLVEKINSHYSQNPPPNLSPYSFSANKYRISLFFGAILILSSLYSLKSRNNSTECVNKDGVFKNISNTVTGSAQSLGVLYNLYKEGGIEIVSEFAKIKNNNKNQKIHVNFNEISKADKKNVLICGEKFTAEIGVIKANQTQNIEYKIMDLIAGEEIYESKNLANIFFQLSENDNVSAVFDDPNNENSIIVYISKIKPESNYFLGFYEVISIYDGTGTQLKCGNKTSIEFKLYNISENSAIIENKINDSTQNLPILLERVLMGKSIGSKIKVITKLDNLCIFREGPNYDLCRKLWNFKENEMKSVISLTLEIEDVKDK